MGKTFNITADCKPDFQVQMSHAKFRSENAFSLAFAKAVV